MDSVSGHQTTSASCFSFTLLLLLSWSHLSKHSTSSQLLIHLRTLLVWSCFFAISALPSSSSQGPALQHSAATPLHRLLSPFVSVKNRLNLNFKKHRRSHLPHTSSSICSKHHLDDHLFARDVTVQLFQWKYEDVGNECVNFLGPNGYRYVQISPPHEHILGPQWWTDYQPVSYKIGSKRGSEADFDLMIERCSIAVLLCFNHERVLNHMTAGACASQDQLGTIGSSYRKYEYPNMYRRNNFHKCRKRGSLEIHDYMNRYEVQNCELVGLADLKTSQKKVQNEIRGYLNRLISKGVAGFRIDAAKHIPVHDLMQILNVDVDIKRVVLEVMYVGGEPIRPEEYMPVGRVHIFQAAYDLKRMFLTDGIAYLGQPVPWGEKWGDGYLPSSHSQVFVTNWDLERNSNALRIDEDPSTYLLSQVFILTWGYGQVDVFSGYNFTHYDDGPRSADVVCGWNGWRCEHRNPIIVGAIRLRAASYGLPIQNIVTDGSQRLGFSRGSKVFVALNNDVQPWRLGGIVAGLPIQTSQDEQPYQNVLNPGDQQSITLHLDTSTGKTVFDHSVLVPPKSAIGMMTS